MRTEKLSVYGLASRFGPIALPMLLSVGCSTIEANTSPDPNTLADTTSTPPATATATVTATFTPTRTNTLAVPSPTTTRTETPRPTATKTATKPATPIPTRTQTPEAKPTLSQLNGKSMAKAMPIKDGTKITVKPSETVFAVVGRKGTKVDELRVTSFSGNPRQMSTKMYSPESLNQLGEALAGRTEMPGNVGALIYSDRLGRYETYSGKTGSSEGFLTLFINSGTQDVTYTFFVLEKAAFCDSYDTVTYNEGFWWTTCDPNWTGAFKEK